VVATNAAAVERGGLLALTAGPEAGEEQVRRVRLLPSRLGTVITVPEAAQDLAAATLGSGAAFLVCVAGGMLEAAAPAGREAAVAFTVVALRTAALIVEGAPESGAAWDALATPGGITAAGLRSMIDDRVPESLAAAVGAALSRAAVLTPS
jgi:pyrroline-5-carboxylate reductase